MFDIVGVKLLIPRLKIIGLPIDLVWLIKVWLKEQNLYVSVGEFTTTIMITWFRVIHSGLDLGANSLCQFHRAPFLTYLVQKRTNKHDIGEAVSFCEMK